MNETDYRRAMEHFTPAPGLRERTARAVEENREPRPRLRPVRTALLAAALCAALVGTAFAGLQGIKDRYLPHLEPYIDGAGRFAGYMVSGELETYPLNDFSNAFHEAAKTRTGRVDMAFADLEQARAYLGEDIPCTWPNGWDGEFIVSLYHDENGAIWGSEVISWEQSGHASVRMQVLTEKYSKNEQKEKILGLYGDPDSKMERLDSYLMPNSCVAESFTIGGTENDPNCACISFFISDGNIYEIYAWDVPDNQAGLWPKIQAILDSFE